MIDTTVYPNHIVTRYDLATGPIMDRSEQELKARAYYFEQAAKGDAGAKLMLKTHPTWRLTGWYRREYGDVIGEHLSRVAREREGDESL